MGFPHLVVCVQSDHVHQCPRVELLGHVSVLDMGCPML